MFFYVLYVSNSSVRVGGWRYLPPFEAFFPCQTALPAGRAVSVVLPQRKVEDKKNAVGLKSRNPSDHGVFPNKTIRKAYTAQLLQAARKGAELAGLAKSKG